MDDMTLFDLPSLALADPKWLYPDRTGTKAGTCMSCDRTVTIAEIQQLHPDATIRNYRAMQYDKCPVCKSLLIPF